MTGTDTVGETVTWLIEGARTVNSPMDVLDQICARLSGAGVAIERCSVFVETLHPSIVGRRFRWSRGLGVDVGEASIALVESDAYRKSPIAEVYRSGTAVRRRLCDPDCPDDFEIVADLRSEEMTDYLIQPLHFSNGEVHAVSWITRRPGGFNDRDLAAFEAIRAPLSRVAEVYALRRMATNLLNTYVGERSGAQILDGHIRRGDVEAIETAILLSDLRGFSSLAESIDGPQLIEILNRHFDCLVAAIRDHGGEVLKFMGDGMLAIFPSTGTRSESEASQAALSAAIDARKAMAGLNADRVRNGDTPLGYGISLHFGNIHYGNIGGGDRLDFTAIGPAVNIAARLDGVAAATGRDIVASAEFCRVAGFEGVPLGSHSLKGSANAVDVFAVPV